MDYPKNLNSIPQLMHPPSTTKKPRLFRTVFAPLLAGLLCSVFLLEIITRIVFSTRLDYQIEMCRYAVLLKHKRPDSPMGHEHIPNKKATLMGVPVEINSYGFRDRERPLLKKANTYRIFVLGDSLTFGWGVPAEQRFSDLLEEMSNQYLEQRHSLTRVEVINAGIGNFNTVQELALFREKGTAWQPDLIILNYFINDAEPTPERPASSFFRFSYLAAWLWERWTILQLRMHPERDFLHYYRGLYQESQPGWRQNRLAIQNLARLAKERHAKLLVAILPELHTIGLHYAFKDIHQLIEQTATHAGADTVIDLEPLFQSETPKDLWVHPEDSHPNARAQALIAKGLFQFLLKQGPFYES